MAQILLDPQVAGEKCTQKYKGMKQWKETAHAVNVKVKIAKEPQNVLDITLSPFSTERNCRELVTHLL
jgi:hypothetical protein